MVFMKTVSVSDLKARLSSYLREVQRGSEIQVLDRGVPVARLVQPGPAQGAELSAERRRLIASGVLRAGKGNSGAILKSPPLKLRADISGAVNADRKDRV